MRSMTPAAIGFRTHSGWASAVTIAGESARLRVVDRRRIELIPDGTEAAQVYHAVVGLPLAEAERKIAAVRAQAQGLARQALERLAGELARQGCELVAAGLVLGSGRPPDSLEAVLAAHTLIHMAEGELYRGVLLEAAEASGLRTGGLPARELATHPLRHRALAIGEGAGRPWGADQKDATLVALVALTASG
jgi:hypothetical protein